MAAHVLVGLSAVEDGLADSETLLSMIHRLTVAISGLALLFLF
jgi:hypothetical protein